MTFRRFGQWLAFVLTTTGPAMADMRMLDWADLHGWSADTHIEALEVFRNTCGDMKDGDWPAVCAMAAKQKNAKVYFETFFRPVLITDEEEPLFTGYYEPELFGSLTKSSKYRHALYRRPEDAPNGQWLTRRELDESRVLEGRDLEIAWLESPVDKFFLQIQGSGRIKLKSGDSIRVGYGGKNGHPYRSVGNELVRQGIFEPHQVSAQVIRRWVENNPSEGRELLYHNPSYVFFREVTQVPADQGPLGAMNRSITAGRSVAVDTDFVPLGAPVWLEKDGKTPIRKLMIAQDTGAAINGAQRADIFYGTGDEAGKTAGRIRDGGRMVLLLPINEAKALVGEKS